MSKNPKVKIAFTFFKYILGLIFTLAGLYLLASMISDQLGLKQDIAVPIMIIIYTVISPIIESIFIGLQVADYKIEEPLEEP
jgi:hypothetical protein